MAQLAIKGHPTRGKEVIKILEMLGGRKEKNLGGSELFCWYYINENGDIDYKHYSLFTNTKVFTLEKFLKKFPYKVGDKVSSKYLKNYEISKMEWENTNNRVIYKLQGMGWYAVNELQPYKEETMEKVKDNWAKWDLPDGYEFQDKDGNIINTSVIKLVKKQPHYPKTYEECCTVLQDACMTHKGGYKGNLMQTFQKLLICRDTYWKIAEQMGLGKSWKPDWNNANSIKSVLYISENKIHKGISLINNHILVFPTKEMRDTFYKNFKDLIEYCKELL